MLQKHPDPLASVNDDVDNPGFVPRSDWHVHTEANGTVWIGGQRIGWADKVSRVPGDKGGVTTLVITVRSDDCHITSEANPAVDLNRIPQGTPKPLGMQVADVSERVSCQCGHSPAVHRKTNMGMLPWSTGGVTCKGNGTGPCTCRSFKAVNLCECGHTHGAHIKEAVDLADGSVALQEPCKYPTDMGQFCDCTHYRKTDWHDSAVTIPD